MGFSNPSTSARSNAQSPPSVVSTVSLTKGEVTSTKSPKFPELPCLPSKLTCQSTSLLVSWLTYDLLPVAKPFLSACLIIGKFYHPALLTTARSHRRSLRVSERERVSHQLSHRLTDFMTSCKLLIVNLKTIITK